MNRSTSRQVGGVLFVFVGFGCARAADPPAVATRPGNDWPRPRVSERAEERAAMVRRQIASGYDRQPVKDPRVLEAMRNVPRHLFVPEAYQVEAYADSPLPIGERQTISQPYIVALMTELLELKPTDKVLEIGTGSGYQAAVLSELTPHVYSIEIVKPLADQAIERFKKLGYATVMAKHGDGYQGWKEYAPFDAIIVTCDAEHLPPPLWEQLKPGGRIAVPMGEPYGIQHLMLITKTPEGKRVTKRVLGVRFVPMTGEIEKR
jgi:protein-L-isoaspartate(D-aspartate) O-methyltransferase